MSTNMKSIISETFFRMVKEKGIDRITVKDLVETCHISRQTFYYHFQDILDVVEWSARETVHRAVQVSLSAQSPEEAIRVFVMAAHENRVLIEKLLRSQKREQIEKILSDGLQSYLMEMVRSIAPGLNINLEDMSVALEFYSFGIAGVMLDRCGREQFDPDKLTRQLMSLLQGKLFPVGILNDL